MTTHDLDEVMFWLHKVLENLPEEAVAELLGHCIDELEDPIRTVEIAPHFRREARILH